MKDSRAQVTRLPVELGDSSRFRVIEKRCELARIQPGGPVYDPVYFDLKPGNGFFRGGHYHKTATEFFYVISGSCRIKLEDTETGEKETLVVSQGDFMTIAPGLAHRFEAVEFCRMVEFSSKEADYHEDTVRHEFF